MRKDVGEVMLSFITQARVLLIGICFPVTSLGDMVLDVMGEGICPESSFLEEGFGDYRITFVLGLETNRTYTQQQLRRCLRLAHVCSVQVSLL